MTGNPHIADGSRVAMHFSITLEDGTPVISTYEDEPLYFRLGDGTLEPLLESRLIGLKAGDGEVLVLSGNEVYGPWDDDNRQWIDAIDFPASLQPVPGQVIAFTTPAGDEVAGWVERVEDDRVLLDFNHPLSGRTFVFTASILEVEQPE